MTFQEALQNIGAQFPEVFFLENSRNKMLAAAEAEEETGMRVAHYYANKPLTGFLIWYGKEHPANEFFSEENTGSIYLLQSEDAEKIVQISNVFSETHSKRTIAGKLIGWREKYGALHIIRADYTGLVLQLNIRQDAILPMATEIADFCPDIWSDFEHYKEPELISSIPLEDIVSLKHRAFGLVTQQTKLLYEQGISESRSRAIKAIAEHLRAHNTINLWWD